MNDREKVLICIDGSENSLRAVEFARDMLLSSDSFVTLLVVVTPMDCDYFMDKSAPVCDIETIGKVKSSSASSILEESGTRYCVSTMSGSPAEVILKAAPKYELVVMGRKGSGSERLMTLGGVAGQVSQNIMVPLLLVP